MMLLRGETAHGWWECWRGEPSPPLRALIRGAGYEGFDQWFDAPMRRLELPHAGIVLIASLGPRVDVDGDPHTSFVAGLYDTPVVVGDDGHQSCLQANLTPLGARMLLGLPLRELAGQTVALDDVLGGEGANLGERLAALPDWPARFAAFDAFLLARLRAAAAPRPDVAYAWARLEASHGRVAIGALCRELGCSGRHLSARFGAEVGMAPKAFSRVLRFERAAALLAEGAGPAQVSATCGFADQSHLNREFRALAGRSPVALVKSVTNVQDGLGIAA
jgi:AraC-like DNA-binding protein